MEGAASRLVPHTNWNVRLSFSSGTASVRTHAAYYADDTHADHGPLDFGPGQVPCPFLAALKLNARTVRVPGPWRDWSRRTSSTSCSTCATRR